MIEPKPEGEPDAKSHYHFSITLRVRHPDADPDRITKSLGVLPGRAWKAGDPRTTPTGTKLQGNWPATYWFVNVLAGRYPTPALSEALQTALDRVERFRDFFHDMRSEGGSVELFIGWCFERQSGDVFGYGTLAKAADLKVDLSFDIYPPTQPQNEREVVDVFLPP